MDKNKLKISTKSLKEIANITKEPEWFNLIRKKSMYENYDLKFPNLHSMNLEEWGLLDFDINTFIEDNNYVFNKEEFAEEINFEEESIVIIQKSNKLVYLDIPERFKSLIFVNDIFTAMNNNSDKFKDTFTKITTTNKNKISSLHYVLLNSGIYIEVEDNAIIDIPIQYAVIVDKVEHSLYNHLALNVGKNANINFIENYISKENQKSFNIISEVLLLENANVNYSSVTNFSNNQKGTILRNAYTNRSSVINWNIAAMDNADVFHDNTTNLLGDGSEGNLKIVTLGTDKQKVYFNSELVNQGLNTNGDILQHGVLLDESHIVFNGVGFIVKGASGSNAYQSSRLLTLSDKAKSDANPMLLIDENDVAAGHGASLGKIDEEQIYYLKSRGLSQKEASRLLVHGFLSPVIEKLSVKKVQEKAVELIDTKINK
ncbi:Fe-S cluster assembly protein SufD [Gemelliphila palaticanis]|uniref:Fe-S cluster assembly protein SufD n=1 Tax=Gemelliphila palaticanis TaxID=81950 RepID=A0ABX2SY84_9BACL|nr:Fe-S cluster assembly protein SufD [Gemella palaticanis]MBF0715341.1 Fe-S cluster assembly protein SufD [Gemella palaticanis]NYS47271.1 Fe-S cluster assembly protein SufD [Gemella palaticanis]